MSAPCAPFTLTEHLGHSWITRGGYRVRVASPEEMRLWAERNGVVTDGTIETVTTPWGYAIELSGDWADDAATLREVAAALEVRAKVLEADGDGRA